MCTGRGEWQTRNWGAGRASCAAVSQHTSSSHKPSGAARALPSHSTPERSESLPPGPALKVSTKPNNHPLGQSLQPPTFRETCTISSYNESQPGGATRGHRLKPLSKKVNHLALNNTSKYKIAKRPCLHKETDKSHMQKNSN